MSRQSTSRLTGTKPLLIEPVKHVVRSEGAEANATLSVLDPEQSEVADQIEISVVDGAGVAGAGVGHVFEYEPALVNCTDAPTVLTAHDPDVTSASAVNVNVIVSSAEPEQSAAMSQ